MHAHAPILLIEAFDPFLAAVIVVQVTYLFRRARRGRVECPVGSFPTNHESVEAYQRFDLVSERSHPSQRSDTFCSNSRNGCDENLKKRGIDERERERERAGGRQHDRIEPSYARLNDARRRRTVISSGRSEGYVVTAMGVRCLEHVNR